MVHHLPEGPCGRPCDFHPDRPSTARFRDRWGAAYYCDDCTEDVRPDAAANAIPAPDEPHRDRLARALARWPAWTA